ncbi:hypothetical protein BKI52_27140 [marine bacterium AO1-C]|nr:hypothetical protein BKI52_27140 [marine bacterium AO1-C]
MIEQLFKGRYVTFYYDHQQKCITDSWTCESKILSPRGFQDHLLQWKDLVFQHKAKKALVDARKLRVMIYPEIQTWIAHKIIAPVVNGGLEKIAVVLPSALFEKVILKQVLEEFDEFTSLKKQVFDDLHIAQAWVLS